MLFKHLIFWTAYSMIVLILGFISNALIKELKGKKQKPKNKNEKGKAPKPASAGRREEVLQDDGLSQSNIVSQNTDVKNSKVEVMVNVGTNNHN